MAQGFLYFVAGGLLLILVAGIVMYVVKTRREREEPENQPIIENYHIVHSKGHSDGIVDEVEIGESRIKITFFPRDINYIKEINKKESFIKRPITIYYDRKQVQIYPIGTLSMHRAKIKAFPSNSELIPESIKNTKWGEMIGKEINKNNQLKDESELLNQRMKNLRKVSKEVVGGEIFMDYMKKSKDINKDISDSVRKDDRKMPFDTSKSN